MLGFPLEFTSANCKSNNALSSGLTSHSRPLTPSLGGLLPLLVFRKGDDVGEGRSGLFLPLAGLSGGVAGKGLLFFFLVVAAVACLAPPPADEAALAPAEDTAIVGFFACGTHEETPNMMQSTPCWSESLPSEGRQA